MNRRHTRPRAATTSSLSADTRDNPLQPSARAFSSHQASSSSAPLQKSVQIPTRASSSAGSETRAEQRRALHLLSTLDPLGIGSARLHPRRLDARMTRSAGGSARAVSTEVDRASESDSSHDGNVLTSVMASAKRLQGLLKAPSEDLYIELSEPYRIYQPGDTVAGQAILRLTKATPTRYVSLRIAAQVLTGHGKQRVRSTLFSERLLLYGREEGSDEVSTGSISDRPRQRKWQTQTMEPGRHVFDFACDLPDKSLPSSVDFERGKITYFVQIEHARPRTLLNSGKSSCRKNLQFQDLIDIALIPRPRPAIIDPDAKSKRREGSGRVRATIELDKAGYLAGQTVALAVHLQHIKPIKNMRGVVATFYRLSRFNSDDLAPQSFRKDLAQSVSPLLVDPSTLQFKVSPRLKIPADAFPTVKEAGPVSFRYYVEVVLDLSARTTIWQTAADSLGYGAAGGNSHFGGDMTGWQAINTEALKRERDVYCEEFEVTLGTKDSGQTIVSPAGPQRSRTDVLQTQATQAVEGQGSASQTLEAQGSAKLQYGRQRSCTMPAEPLTSSLDAAASEKRAMRQFEASLLPSEPPLAYDDTSTSGVAAYEESGSSSRHSGALRPRASSQPFYPVVLRPSSPPNIPEHGESHANYERSGSSHTESSHRRVESEAMLEQELPSYLQAGRK